MSLSYPDVLTFQECWSLHPVFFYGHDCLLSIGGQDFAVTDGQSVVIPLTAATTYHHHHPDPLKPTFQTELPEAEWTPAIKETLGIIARTIDHVREHQGAASTGSS